MHASVYLNIGKILLLPAPLTALIEPYNRLSFLFSSLINPLLRLFFLLRDSVRSWLLFSTLCSQPLGLSWFMRGVK